jgi:cytochrome P450
MEAVREQAVGQVIEQEAGLVRASALDTLRVIGEVFLPLVAQGVIMRRPRMVALAARLDLQRRGDQVLRSLRARYGSGPVLLRLPGRTVAIVLDAGDARRVLDESPDPFSLVNREKRGALRHFEPTGVLVTRGPIRGERRRINEAVLEPHRRVHHLGGAFAGVVADEAAALLDAAGPAGELDWQGFSEAWWRVVRRIVLGDSARDDRGVTDLLNQLRRDANWSYLRPVRASTRHRFLARLRWYLEEARASEADHDGPAPGSAWRGLVGVLSRQEHALGADPAGQIPQWLFAFDAAGIAAYRTLALLATHREQARQARADSTGGQLRACVLESLRLWPTTSVILRDTTAPTLWRGRGMPAGTAVALISSYFHRDLGLPFADRFAPEIWLDGTPGDGLRPAHSPAHALIPFSAGPGECPGRDLALFTASTLLAVLMRAYRYTLEPAVLDPAHALPATLNYADLRFVLTTDR